MLGIISYGAAFVQQETRATSLTRYLLTSNKAYFAAMAFTLIFALAFSFNPVRPVVWHYQITETC